MKRGHGKAIYIYIYPGQNIAHACLERLFHMLFQKKKKKMVEGDC